MEIPLPQARISKSWLLALAAVAVCGPWPWWQPSAAALIGLCGGLLALARPRGNEWLPWLAVAVAALPALWPAAAGFDAPRLTDQLDRHCAGMLETGEELATDRDLTRLLSAAGEAVDPSLPFDTLERTARNAPGRTIYLIDDRGQVIAWGGAGNAFPFGLRSLGQRQWGVGWSVAAADLWLREPLFIEGRLVGAIVVSDRTTVRAPEIWGMRAARGGAVSIGQNTSGARNIRVSGRPGVEVPVSFVAEPARNVARWHWFGWLVLAVLALFFQPLAAWLVVALGTTSMVAAEGAVSNSVLALVLLLAGAALGRLARSLRPVWSRTLVVATILTAAVAAVLGTPIERFSWLPDHLQRPGLGGVWMVALAFVIVGWPGTTRSGFSLDRRLFGTAVLAVIGLTAYVVRIPVQLERFDGADWGVVLPRGEMSLDEILPVAADRCRLTDLAPALAESWDLGNWRTPSELRLLDEDLFIVSQWGDLSPATTETRLVRRWPLAGAGGGALELLVATEPWSLLRDWRSGRMLEESGERPIWYAVLTRSGEVAASLHPQIGNLDAIRAGELFHADGGWTWMTVGDDRRLARIRRNGEWLVVAVSHQPSVSDWVIRTAIAMLWALLGSAIALPPVVRRSDLATFGGRLRLLVAGGVVLPLFVLTLFLHQRIGNQEKSLERLRGLEALRAARYTAVHLGGGFAVDDDLAKWLAEGWGGEVSLWDGADLVAVSRLDLLSSGLLPWLPLPETFPPYLLGRDDPSVLKWRDQLVAAGPVDLQDRRLLLHLFQPSSTGSGSDLGAVDWLLTGACLSALLALVLTTRIEKRLSGSLRELVALARKLLDGEPLGSIQRPRETDLAEVLDAVASMNEEVQQREVSLRHQEELLRITLKTLESAVVVLEPDGAERFANPAAHRLEEEHGRLFLDQLRTTVEEASIGGSAAKTVQPIPGRDLTWRIGVAGVPFPDGSLGLVAVVDDVTDLVRADRALQLNQMARIVAHEVKNPLTPVRLWVQELEAAVGRDDPELPRLLDEACREIAVQVARLEETANSFSNLVALEHWEPVAVNLQSVLEGVPAGSEIFARRGIRFEHEVADPAPFPIRGDRHWLHRAVSNLVQNSIDALADEAGTITLRLFGESERVVLEVEDSGGGVPDARLPDLFSPHFSTTTAGSGLGLALVHQVVTRCHGRVEAANGTRGLIVRLEFPPMSDSADAAPSD
ncbi:MAG: ATP-binding protein [Acidobacteriota bacterium]|nr:ATP-binding protein [Acidobacteriota bacterium]